MTLALCVHTQCRGVWLGGCRQIAATLPTALVSRLRMWCLHLARLVVARTHLEDRTYSTESCFAACLLRLAVLLSRGAHEVAPNTRPGACFCRVCVMLCHAY